MINLSDSRKPSVGEIIELYKKAKLHRPFADKKRIESMYANANLILAAWDKDTLVGILRGWTDNGYSGYICDLAIDPEYQKQGIGKQLLDKAVAMYPQIEFILRASVIAADYYKNIGWSKIENGWYMPRKESL